MEDRSSIDASAEAALESAEEELQRAQSARRREDRELSMSERLARLHDLCVEMSAVKDTARGR